MEIQSCCQKEKKNNGLMQGILYGTIPHIGCIGFVVFSLLGVTILSSIFKPLLAKSYFFYIMIALSLIFASFSALLYLRKNGGIKSIKNHKKYLSILYGSTIAVSLILYFLIFPLVGAKTASSGTAVLSDNQITIKVAIPCEGHAPLISQELKNAGVNSVKFSSPNIFSINYPSSITKEEILNLEIFQEYKARVIG